MKPYKTLLFLLVFMVLLYGPSLFSGSTVRLPGNIIIDLPQIDNLLEPIASLKQADPIDTIATDTKSFDRFVKDTVSGSRVHRIIAPDSSGNLLRLNSLIDSTDKQFRIIYYGDSQLEGDRITDYIRKELRSDRFGTGPGLVSPTMLVSYTRTAYLRTSSNWLRYNYLSSRRGEINHRDLGPLLSVSRFEEQGGSETEAWIRVSPSNTADDYASQYDNIRILYGNLKDSLALDILEDRRLTYSTILAPTDQAEQFRYKLSRPGSIEVRFRGISSPDIYAISLESDSGIIVDNVPLRGSAGLEFSKLGEANLQSLYDMLDPDLIILHFGLNVVLNERDDYSYYENNIYSQLTHLKQLCPETEFLVLSVTDMAREDSTGIHSYSNIPLIVSAQRRAASRANVFFWDAWAAMGGEDAIVKWRNSQPPLASNDYTHISYEGGHKLGKMLTDALTTYDSNSVEVTDSVIIESDQDISLVRSRSGLKDIFTVYDSNNPLVFTSVGFWLFLLILLIGYSALFGKPVIRNSYLFIFSLFFYFKSGGVFFILLIISTITDYLAGWMIYLAARKGARKFWLLLSLFVNLGMLAYFKYTGFITSAINDLLGTAIPEQDWLAVISNNYLGTGFNVSSIILPVGISFFTFQTISYTIDVYRNKTKPVRNILDFGFYVSFFPQLVAGPIVRASEFIPQLYQEFKLSSREWGHALFLIMAGLIKKVIVSDYIAVNFVDKIFDNPGLYSGLENLLAIYGYGLQIYCDFSGYTDIAIGVALMLGFRLPVNFHSPYKANNITDFWRRWHISLSRWLKDYLYISLGGNRKGRVRTSVNLFITMLLGGLWHGAALKFIVWGGLHGMGLMVHKMWRSLFPKEGKISRIGMAFSVFLTFNFVSFCWIFFRARSLDDISIIFNRITTSFSPGDLTLFLQGYANVLIVIAAGYIIHFLPSQVKESYRGLFIKLPLIVKMVLLYLVAIALFNIQATDIQPFIYFRF